MSRVAAGDEAAFNRLVLRHTPPLHVLALRFTGRRADADEVVQDVFWTLWRTAHRWRPGGARLGTYLHRLTVNRCLDAARRARVRSLLFSTAAADETADQPDERAAADDAITHRQALASVLAAIRRLPDRQRMAIILAATEERTAAECAEMMGLTANAFDQLLHRARANLKKFLGGPDDPDRRSR